MKTDFDLGFAFLHLLIMSRNVQGNRVHDEKDSRNLHAPGNIDEVVGHH